MKLILEPLRTTDLSNMEAGQIINRHLADLGTIAPTLLTNVPYNTYIQNLGAYRDTYEKALGQIQKSEKTQKISLADRGRDKAVTAFSYGLKFYAMSDEEEEVEASRGLRIIFDNFKKLTKLNYEAESIAIDKLVSELEKPAQQAKVSKLNMDRYVTRLKNTNGDFKTLFSNRMVNNAMTENYDMKNIRLETFKCYREFCTYVLAMAKALNSPLFTTSLDLLNTARSYYSDLLARRKSKEGKQPQTPE